MSVLSEDVSQYPRVKGRFYAFDSSLNLAMLSRADIGVKEFADSKNILSFTNAVVGQREPVSYIFAIGGSRSLGITDMNTIRKAFRKWFTSFSKDQGECAIISYTTNNRLLTDFTADTAVLSSALLKARYSGDNDYNDGLITDTAGALLVSRRARYKPVVVVIQNGRFDSVIKVSTIIDQAKAQNCPVYNLFFETRRSKEHVTISNATGGLVLDELSTADDFTTAFCTIQALSQGVRPCIADWQSTVSCITNHVLTEYSWNGIQKNQSYVTPSDRGVAILCSPSVVDFGQRAVPGAYDTTITVTARTLDATILSIAGRSGSNVFSIVNTNLPMTIPANTSVSLTIRYTPQDSATQQEYFSITSESCIAQFLCQAGPRGRADGNFKVTFPNGGEKLVVGSDTTLSWDGVSPDDTVKLEYSIDNGTDWIRLEQQATSLQHAWQRIPLPTSDSCLIRVTHTIGDQADSASDPLINIGGHSSDIQAMAWSPNGQYLASIDDDGSLIVWDMRKGSLKSFHGFGNPYDLAWKPDGSEILVVSGIGNIALLDVETDSFTPYFNFNTSSGIVEVTWSNDGQQFILGHYAAFNIRYDRRTMTPIDTILARSDSLSCVEWSPDGRWVAMVNLDRSISIYDGTDLSKPLPIARFVDHVSDVVSLKWSPDSKYLATGDVQRRVNIWDLTGMYRAQSFRVESDTVTSISWSFDGKFLATGVANGIVQVWDAATAKQTDRFVYGPPKARVAWSTTDYSLSMSGVSTLISIWDMSTRGMINQFKGHVDRATMLKWKPDNSALFTVGRVASINVYDITSRSVRSYIQMWNSMIRDAEWNPVDDRIAVVTSDAVISIWNSNDGSLLDSLKRDKFTYVNPRLCWDIDGIGLISTGVDSSIIYQNPDTWEVYRSIFSTRGDVRNFARAPDGGRIVAGHEDGSVVVWNYRTGEFVRELYSGLEDASLFDVEWSPDGTLIAAAISHFSGKASVELIVWNANTGMVVSKLTHPGLTDTLEISNLVWHPDSKQLLFSGMIHYRKGLGLIVWDVELNRVVWTSDTTYGFPDAAWNASGTMLAALRGTQVYTWPWAAGIARDTSDSLFSIVAPAMSSTDIDMGPCFVLQAKDSVVTGHVKNTSSYPVYVDSIYVTGTDANSFGLTSPFVPFITPANDSSDVGFRFRPSRVGLHTAQVVIVARHDTLYQTIVGTGVDQDLRPVDTLIDFGRVFVGLAKDTIGVLTVVNTGSVDLQIDSVVLVPVSGTSFEILSGGLSFVLQPAASHSMNLRFAPQAIGQASARLLFYRRQVTSPIVINVIGEGIYLDTARYVVALNHSTAVVGDHFTIEMTLEDQSDTVAELLPRAFEARIGINPHIVHQSDNSDNCLSISPNRCVIDVTGTIGSTSVLYSTEAMATLGNTDNDVLTIESFRWTDTRQPYTVTTENGSIHITDICEEGGTRLYVSNNARYSLACRPNPASSLVNLVYGLAGSATVTIEILSFTGEVVFVPLQDVAVQSGLYTLPVDISQFGDGVYIVQLRTRVATLTSLMTVQK